MERNVTITCDGEPRPKYIFRWCDDQLEVPAMWSYDEEEVWRAAIAALHPASIKDPEEAEQFVRAHGEVVEVSG